MGKVGGRREGRRKGLKRKEEEKSGKNADRAEITW